MLAQQSAERPTLMHRLRNAWFIGFVVVAVTVLSVPSLLAGQAATNAEAARRSASTKVRPGDQIALNFLRDRELNSTVTVNERGEAVFPKLGRFDVSEMSIARLQDTLRARYSDYLRSPEFEIVVLRRVAVNGEVKVPNVYFVDPNTTVRDVIARAGGLTEYGSRSKVAIIRSGNRHPVRNWDRETGGLFWLESGDQVVVGRKNWFLINALSTVSTAVLVASLIITIHRN